MADFIGKIFNETIPGLEKALDLRWRRNQAISSNIANAETPTYKARELDFAGELNKAFEKQDQALTITDERHIDTRGFATAHLMTDRSGATKADGNNVDIDIQMGKLADNSAAYGIAANLLRKKLEFIRNAIRDSRS